MRGRGTAVYDGGGVELQGNEAALLDQKAYQPCGAGRENRQVAVPTRAGLQLRPVRAERIRRDAEHEHAGALQPFLNFRREAVAGAD